MSTKNVAAISVAVLIAFLALIGGITWGVTRNHQIDAQQYTTCLQSGANPSECRLAIYGGRR